MKGRLRMLVTGGSGFLGTEVCLAAAEAGWEVWCVDPAGLGWNSAPGSRRLLQEAWKAGRVRWAPVKIGEVDSAEVGAVDAMVHLAGRRAIAPGPEALVEMTSNVAASAKVLALALEQLGRGEREPAVVMASSAAVYGETAPGLAPERPDRWDAESVNPYGISKVCQELLGQGVPLSRVVQVRYYNLQHATAGGGAEAMMRAEAKRFGRVTVHGDGEQRREFVPVQEAARQTVEVCRQACAEMTAPKVVEVRTGRGVRVMELAERVAREVGAKVVRGKGEAGVREGASENDQEQPPTDECMRTHENRKYIR